MVKNQNVTMKISRHHKYALYRTNINWRLLTWGSMNHTPVPWKKKQSFIGLLLETRTVFNDKILPLLYYRNGKKIWIYRDQWPNSSHVFFSSKYDAAFRNTVNSQEFKKWINCLWIEEEQLPPNFMPTRHGNGAQTRVIRRLYSQWHTHLSCHDC